VSARHVRSQKSGFPHGPSACCSICGVAVSACCASPACQCDGRVQSGTSPQDPLGNNAPTSSSTPEAQEAWVRGRDKNSSLKRAAPFPESSRTPGVKRRGDVSEPVETSLASRRPRVDPGRRRQRDRAPEHIRRSAASRTSRNVGTDLRHLPPERFIGIGPGGERYLKGNDLTLGAEDGGTRSCGYDPAVSARRSTHRRLAPGLIIGRELAKTLHVYVGDEVTLVSPLGDPGPMGSCRGRGSSGRRDLSANVEYDASTFYTTKDVAEDYFQRAGQG